MTVKFKVGDEVVLVEPRYSHHRDAGVKTTRILRVGRKYAYLEDDPRETPFSLRTGIEHRSSDYKSYLKCIYLPDEYAAEAHRDGLLQQLTAYAFISWGIRELSTVKLEKLLAVLNEDEQ